MRSQTFFKSSVDLISGFRRRRFDVAATGRVCRRRFFFERAKESSSCVKEAEDESVLDQIEHLLLRFLCHQGCLYATPGDDSTFGGKTDGEEKTKATETNVSAPNFDR